MNPVTSTPVYPRNAGTPQLCGECHVRQGGREDHLFGAIFDTFSFIFRLFFVHFSFFSGRVHVSLE